MSRAKRNCGSEIKVCPFYICIVLKLLLVVFTMFFDSLVADGDRGMDNLVGRTLQFDIRSPAGAATSGRGRRILIAESHTVVAVPVVGCDRLRHRTRR